MPKRQANVHAGAQSRVVAEQQSSSSYAVSSSLAAPANKRVHFADPDLDDGVSDEEEEGNEPVVMRKKRQFGQDDEDEEDDPHQQRTKRARDANDEEEDVDISVAKTKHAVHGGVEGEEAYDENALDELEKEQGDIEPFNLNAEREMGRFGNDGSFVWTRRDLDNDDDPWLEQVADNVESRKPKSASLGRDEDKAPMSQKEGFRLMTTIARILLNDETCLLALRRLSAAKDKKDFAAITEAADELLSQGMMNVYSEKREAFLKRLPKMSWIYKVNGETHGPFSGFDMESV